jgi:glycosyltransferase involved in cell wall biosynthesis
VRFHGAVDHRRMPEYLDNCDILLNPTNVDNMPMTLLEAFAAGLPVVSTDVGGIPDMLGESAAALLVKPGDYREMARKVEHLVADGDLVRRMTESGRRLAQGFDWPAVREKLLAVYYPNKKLASWVESPGAE